jgi:hypothetical protein
LMHQELAAMTRGESNETTPGGCGTWQVARQVGDAVLSMSDA